jgi:hypothetical protein
MRYVIALVALLFMSGPSAATTQPIQIVPAPGLETGCSRDGLCIKCCIDNVCGTIGLCD